MSGPNTQEARIASLWAAGKTSAEIIEITGSHRQYVGQVIGKICANIRYDVKFEGDCGKHLDLITAARALGFPSMPSRPTYRVHA